MAAPAIALAPLTEAEFLAWEERQDLRHEFSPSGLKAMAGASYGHNVVADNLAALLPAALKGKPCRFVGMNMKLRVNANVSFYYPDGMIACPPNVVHERQGVIDNPTVIFEVLSPEPQARDMGEKAIAYLTVPSAREYVLLASDSPDATVYRRGETRWEADPISGLDAVLRLESVGIEIFLSEIYESALSEPSSEEDTLIKGAETR